MTRRMSADRARALMNQWQEGRHVHVSSMRTLIRLGLMRDAGSDYEITPLGKRFARAHDSAPFGCELPEECEALWGAARWRPSR